MRGGVVAMACSPLVDIDVVASVSEAVVVVAGAVDFLVGKSATKAGFNLMVESSLRRDERRGLGAITYVASG